MNFLRNPLDHLKIVPESLQRLDIGFELDGYISMSKKGLLRTPIEREENIT